MFEFNYFKRSYTDLFSFLIVYKLWVRSLMIQMLAGDYGGSHSIYWRTLITCLQSRRSNSLAKKTKIPEMRTS